MTETEVRDFNPFAGDPLAQLDALRTDHRIVHSPSMSAYLVLSLEGCQQVLRDDSVYSSAFALGGPLAANNPPEVMETLPGFLQAPVTAVVDADLPQHAELRRTMRRAYHGPWVESLVPEMRALAEKLVTAFPDVGDIDLVSGYSDPFVRKVMARVLGIPGDMEDSVARWAADMETVISPLVASSSQAKMAAANRLREYETWADGFVAGDRESRDVMQTYVRGAEDAEPLSRESAIYCLLVHYVAGTVTTGHAIATAIDAVLRHTQAWDRLRADPDGYAGAVCEEALRYAAPHRGLLRITTADTELEGLALPAGTLVLPMLQSAGRDESHIADARSFDPDRDAGRQAHVSFGHGRHLCVGSELARKEAGEALSALARLAPDVRLSRPEEAVEITPNYFFHGPAAVPALRA